MARKSSGVSMMLREKIAVVSCRLSNGLSKSPPIGPMYLVSSLRLAGFDAQLIDFQNSEGSHIFDVSGLVKAIERTEARIVAISFFGDTLPLVLKSIEKLGGESSDRIFILGGPGVNSQEIDILRRFQHVNVIVRGEGEHVLPGIVQSLIKGIVPVGPGIFSRGPDGQPTGESPKRIQDLDSLSLPSFGEIDLSNYTRLAIVTSRGCPFDCSFCEIITMWGRSTGYRSIDCVLDELESMVRLAPGYTIDFLDDTFTLNKKRVLRICEEIVRRRLLFRWTCFSRIDTIDVEMMEAMARAGCYNVFFGIDTGSELMWKNTNKRLSKKKVLETSSKSLNFFDMTASFIWGYPDETFSDFEDTVDLAYEVACLPGPRKVWTQLHFLSPTRATPIFEKHHKSLKFSEKIELEVIGAKLSRYSRKESYQECVALIVSDDHLFSPFYYYDSPDLDRKLAVTLESEKLGLGAAFRKMTSNDPSSTSEQEIANCKKLAESDAPLERLANRVAFHTVRESVPVEIDSLFSGF